jgi:RNA polymerase sigma-70 factor (ECF subfamily)
MGPLRPEELGRLYRDHAPALRLYARQYGEGAEDLVQEAFVKLAQQSPPPEQILAWLYRVVRNGALQAHRGEARRRQRESRASASEQWFARVEEQLDAREAVARLADLALEQREAIVARLWCGLTFEQIASLTGCSLATAQRRYLAGLAALKERLERRWTHSACQAVT